MSILLDTHILVWWVRGEGPLSRKQRALLSGISPTNPAGVSDITLWEIAMLQQQGRLQLTLPLRDWLERATAPPLVECWGVTPAIAAAVANLPRAFHGDPADRIIVATALVHGAVLVTSDRKILEARLVPTQA